MIGLDDQGAEDVGVIASAISWLYQLIEERKQQTVGARFSVRVSAVELTGHQQTLRDLLSDSDPQRTIAQNSYYSLYSNILL